MSRNNEGQMAYHQGPPAPVHARVPLPGQMQAQQSSTATPFQGPRGQFQARTSSMEYRGPPIVPASANSSTGYGANNTHPYQPSTSNNAPWSQSAFSPFSDGQSHQQVQHQQTYQPQHPYKPMQPHQQLPPFHTPSMVTPQPQGGAFQQQQQPFRPTPLPSQGSHFGHPLPLQQQQQQYQQQQFSQQQQHSQPPLQPPHASFIPSRSRSPFGQADNNNNRPDSVASMSNTSTYSNNYNDPAKPLIRLNDSVATPDHGRLEYLSDSSLKPVTKPPSSSSPLRYSGTNDPTTLKMDSAEQMQEIDLKDSKDTVLDEKYHNTTPDRFFKAIEPKPVKKRLGLFKKREKVRRFYQVARTGKLSQFSNERLYLLWIRVGAFQGSIAVTLISFGQEGAAMWIGVGCLIMCLLTLIYATTIFHERHLWMVTKRKNVAYFDRVGPTVLAVGLFILYILNFAISMMLGDEGRSAIPWTSKLDGK